jgi:hypothetical protein
VQGLVHVLFVCVTKSVKLLALDTPTTPKTHHLHAFNAHKKYIYAHSSFFSCNLCLSLSSRLIAFLALPSYN